MTHAITFGSVCSGIEAASVAWHPLGWRAAWLSEIEPFPCAVLAHHYPDVPNLGDMTKLPHRILLGDVAAPDVFCGGTPCQAFSVAGLRRSLDDARGNLSLVFCEIANAIDHVRVARGDAPAVIFWENVPGVLSTKDNAFGCFLAGLAGEDDPLEPPGGKWSNAGCVYGPRRAVAWRTMDAQYSGVAQRRRRVFVVASARDGFDPATVLFEWDGVRRDTAPSRETRQVAPTIPSRSTGGGGLGTDFDLDGRVVSTLDASYGRLQGCSGQDMNHGHSHLVPQAYGGNNQSGPIEVATARNACASASASGRIDFETETFLVQPVAHVDTMPTMTAGGPSASSHNAPSGQMRDQYIVPVAFDTTQITSAANRSNPKPGDPCHPLAAGAHAPAIAFPANLSGTQCASAEDIAPAMGALNPTAVAFQDRFRGDDGRGYGRVPPVSEEQIGTLETVKPWNVAFTTKLHNTASNNAGKVFEERTTALDANSPPPALLTAMQVRRLTPVECERLQGFPTVSEKVIIKACLDHQHQNVHVALKCLRWQNSAWPADASVSMPNAHTAAQSSNMRQAATDPLAALHVQLLYGHAVHAIHSRGRLIWSASGAAASEKSPPPTLGGNTAAELARLLHEVVRTAGHGKAASPPSISLSFPASSGATSAEKYGHETAASASGAASAQSLVTYTTSDLGQITTCSDSTAETLCCFALRAIAGCIPSTTLPETFSIELTVETPYTAIPWRNKPADQCPDGPRYKALGNSWAVPVVFWIGRRVDAAMQVVA